MTRKNTIHNLINEAALELLEFVKGCEADYKQHGHKGGGYTYRILENKSLIEYKKTGNRAFY